jgi:hypothetical protein
MVRSRTILAFALLALSGTAACAPAATEGGAGGTAAPSSSRSDVISREELEANASLNMYDLIQRLRPRWLNTRGTRTTAGTQLELVVYQNLVQLGNVENLRQLRPTMAQRVRFLDAQTASASLPGLGSRQVAGAIVIETAPQ